MILMGNKHGRKKEERKEEREYELTSYESLHINIICQIDFGEPKHFEKLGESCCDSKDEKWRRREGRRYRGRVERDREGEKRYRKR